MRRTPTSWKARNRNTASAMRTSHAAGDASGTRVCGPVFWPRSLRCPLAFLSSPATEASCPLRRQDAHVRGAGNERPKPGRPRQVAGDGASALAWVPTKRRADVRRPVRASASDEGRLEPQQSRDRLLVGGRKLVPIELVRADPPMVVDAEVLDRAANQPAPVHAEIDVVALVRVLDVDDAAADLDGDRHLLRQLARERRGIRLAGLDAAA